MTEKQIGILNSALELFADQGINSTSTSQIAKKAKVSEGLIFRHFCNKEGLVRAVVNNAFDRISPYAQKIEEINDPKKRLEALIDMPKKLLGDEPTYWKLQMSIKFQQNVSELMAQCEANSPPIYEMAVSAFKSLDYDKPELEAQLFHMALEGVIFKLVYQNQIEEVDQFIIFLKSKYNLS